MTQPQPLANYTSEHDLPPKIGLTSIETLRSWRQRGIGPPWIKVGRLIFYPNDGIAAWLKSLERTPVRSRPRTTPEHRIRP